MRYSKIYEGIFISRPNRFIANVLIDGVETVCHVKNTGRCRELLIPGTKVLLEKSDNPNRKTKYDLVKVYKGERLINMDSSAPNKVFEEFLRTGGLGFIPEHIKAEYSHGDSRFDFYFERDGVKALAEVKGVTLEEESVARFPDAPTQRGIKHLNGLIDAIKEGYESYAVFIIQMENIKAFEPAWDKHHEFGVKLKQAHDAGVKIFAFQCKVTEDELYITENVAINLNKGPQP